MFISRLRHYWQELRTSFWFVPTVIVIGAVVLASGLIAVDSQIEFKADKKWPLVFGAGAAGARGLLTAVASSMITVAGVVFSITIVALSLTSSQYTSRVLRNLMRDINNQIVLGVFVGIFAYCLVVLRTIRGGDEVAFVPSLAVLTGMVLAFVGIGYLIFFIHHISISVQASSIIAAAAEETIVAVDHLFPKELGDDADEEDTGKVVFAEERKWHEVYAIKTGYIESVDGETLFKWAKSNDTVLRMERGVGEFVIEHSTLLSVACSQILDAKACKELNEIFFISRQRTVTQDAGFGIRQIVDIALKALSPGVNDSTTAVMCIDYLSAILCRLAKRGIATACRVDEGEIRLIARGPTFSSLLAESYDQIRQNSAGNVAVLLRLIQSLQQIAKQTSSSQRLKAIGKQSVMINEVITRSIVSQSDADQIRSELQSLQEFLSKTAESA